ncbi:MAG: DinB family protein [Ignavibacteriales bacterium]|nr:DinB family protein [Ignavibacteriales bacterium]
MTIAQTLLMELNEESKATRAILERVPFENPAYKPHEKSMELLKLAVHVAEIGDWIDTTISTDLLDFSKNEYKPENPKDVAELVKYFDACQAKAQKSLENASDEDLMKDWTMRNGEQIYFTLPKVAVIRTWCMNHLIHHRAQLGVYLRLNNIPLPGSYGPTADEM